MGGSVTFNRFLRERRNRRCAKSFRNALNTRAFESLEALLAPHVVHIDSQFAVIEGREAIIRAFRRLMAIVPDWRLGLDELLVNDGAVMAHGRIHSELPEIAGEGLWTLIFEGGKVAEIQEMRHQRQGAFTTMVDPRDAASPPPPSGNTDADVFHRTH